MDGAIIGLIVTSVATLVLNIYQSVKSRHFESQCCGECMTVKYESEHSNTNIDKKIPTENNILRKPEIIITKMNFLE